ncbi:hAT family dimerization domain-containing protein, partial [Aspergillus glaucus CBS 516.65]
PLGSVPNVLDWWRDNAPCFPILSQMACDFLAVPASGVGVENLFSTAWDVCHYCRNRLAPETIEAIM